jgi:formate dehydrogenase subunit beta
MIDALIDIQDSTLTTIQALLRSLLVSGAVDALLVPMALPSGSVAPMLVKDPGALDQANPLAPVLPINAARAASLLTATNHQHTLGLVLRPCEIRALVELVKFQQANLDNALIIGIDCLGTYSVTDYLAADQDRLLDQLLAGAPSGQPQPHEGLETRAACQICEQPLPNGDHLALSIGLVGVEPGSLYLRARDDLAEPLGITAADPPAGRTAAAQTYINARTQARDAAFAQFRDRVNSMESLLQEFSSCIRCHNCMNVCPICYCKTCVFKSAVFDHEPMQYVGWAAQKGAQRMPSDTLLFHLTRLNHMVTSCVGCGICADVCPVDIPVGTVFRAVGQKAQALFDYHPGRSLDEAAPVQEFREDELTALGERPH